MESISRFSPRDSANHEVRSGSVSTVGNARPGLLEEIMINLNIIQEVYSSHEQVNAAWAAIYDIMPQLVAAKLHHHIAWRNEAVQRIVDEAVKDMHNHHH
jgi:hypothetical protein